MRKFLTLAIAVIAATLAACGGGGDAAPIAQCNGTPRAAVIYVGDNVPGALAGLGNACVYSTDAAGLETAVLRGMDAVQSPRVYLIGNGTTAPLDYMAAHPGHVNDASLWMTPPWTGDLGGSIVIIYANGGACPVTTNHKGPTNCADAAGFDFDTAVRQLTLGG